MLFLRQKKSCSKSCTFCQKEKIHFLSYRVPSRPEKTWEFGALILINCYRVQGQAGLESFLLNNLHALVARGGGSGTWYTNFEQGSELQGLGGGRAGLSCRTGTKFQQQAGSGGKRSLKRLQRPGWERSWDSSAQTEGALTRSVPARGRGASPPFS